MFYKTTVILALLVTSSVFFAVLLVPRAAVALFKPWEDTTAQFRLPSALWDSPFSMETFMLVGGISTLGI